MKRNRITALLLALVMMVSLVPAALAAGSTYRLTVTITDAGPNATGNVVSDSTGYLLGDEWLAAEIGKLVAANYYLEDGSVNPASPLRDFQSDAMREKMEDGLNACRNGEDAWTEFVTEDMAGAIGGAEGDLLELIAEFDTPVSAMTPNKLYSITYVNPVGYDAKAGVTYTVTAQLTRRTSSSTKPLVTILDSENGKTDLADIHVSGSVQVGTTVTIVIKPDDGYRTNRVVVTDQNGKPISITAVDNNTYTFVVPAGGATVSTNFILMPMPVADSGVGRMLNTDPDIAYIQGKTDGNFYPSDSITRGQVATIFYRLLKEEYANVPHTKRFDDVPDDFWCSNAINTLAALGIVKGMTEEEFAPNRAITRAQFVAICARFADTTVDGYTFTDVPESYWAYDYISTGAGFGWINGVGGGKFAPNDPITRAQAVAIVNRMLCRIADRAAIDALEAQFYHDVADTHWAWYEVGEASMGVLTRGD